MFRSIFSQRSKNMMQHVTHFSNTPPEPAQGFKGNLLWILPASLGALIILAGRIHLHLIDVKDKATAKINEENRCQRLKDDEIYRSMRHAEHLRELAEDEEKYGPLSPEAEADADSYASPGMRK